MNASVQSCSRGLKPVDKVQVKDVIYFRFRNGQWRRNFGEGHSAWEWAQRAASRKLRRERVVNRSEA